jgi:CO dehydrogenase maturation factor
VYCAANQFLAMAMDHLADNYQYILVDNEAGMEHLSRLNLSTIDHMLVLSDPSARGLMTASRIAEITKPLNLTVRAKWLIVNRAPDPVPPALHAKIEQTVQEAHLPLAGIFHSSDDLIHQELSGQSYLTLDPDLQVMQEAYAAFDKILSGD